jgi:malonyl CoA-acyl carrier protein transacylase
MMSLPTQPVALSVEQIGELNQKLTTLRHDLNNCLSLIAATAELIRRRPATTDHMWNTLADQPRRITDAIQQFSRDLETALQITRS